ncbi:MAG: hypothetical protein KIC66_14705 [Clostridium sp.]|nr:hypothetical protein [Clostridium sp.]
MFLKNELKDKTIIAAGEATHGTGNFYEFKDRLFRFLVKEMVVLQYMQQNNFFH